MRSRLERGSVFLVALAIMLALVILVGTLALSNNAYVDKTMTTADTQRADRMVDAAIQRGLAELQNATPSPSTLADSWARLGENGATEFTMGTDSFRLQILDESARVNLNKADETALKHLPLTESQIASLLDWREEKTTPRTLGAKDETYNRLHQPYNTKLKDFDSVDELLLVKDFTPATLDKGTRPLSTLLTVDSQSADLSVEGKPKLSLSKATVADLVEIGVPATLASTIIQSASSYQTYASLLRVDNMTIPAAQALLAYCQVGDGKVKTALVNVNTAPQEVLATVPGITPELATAIVARQSSGFQSLADLFSVSGMNLTIMQQCVDSLCVSSRAFRLRVEGRADGLRRTAEAVVTLDDNGGAHIVRIQPIYGPLVKQLWGWPTKPTRQFALGVNQ